MKVIVIGGVAGGASAAARVRRLDAKAEVIVLEKAKQVDVLCLAIGIKGQRCIFFQLLSSVSSEPYDRGEFIAGDDDAGEI